MDGLDVMEPIDGVDGGESGGADDGLDIIGADGGDGGDVAQADAAEPGDGDQPEVDPAAGKEAGAPAVEGNGQNLPDAVKKVIAAVKSTDPKTAGLIRDSFFQNKAYRDAFPTPQDATKAREFMEVVGGEEGWQGVQGKVGEFDQLDQQFRSGSADVVNHMHQQDPEAFNKFAVHAVNKWAESAPDAYRGYANQLALNTLISQPGVKEALPIIQQLHGELAGAPRAQFALECLINGIVGLRDGAAQAAQRQGQQRDPERAKFEQERNSFQEQKQADFERGIVEQVNTNVDTSLKPMITRFAGRELDADQYDMVAAKIREEMDVQFEKQPGVAAQVAALYKAGDAGRAVTYINGQYAKLAEAAVKKVTGTLFRNFSGSAKSGDKPGPRTVPSPSQGGVLTLRDAPGWDKIDRAKTPDADFLMGKAVLKDGRKVTWGQ